MAILPKGRLVVGLLIVLWTIAAIWYEWLQFAYDGNVCQWPDHSFSTVENARPYHVLIIADPQILDHRSYPGRGRMLSFITKGLVDLNLRKNWWVATSKKPDSIVFLGDMMDGGRFDMSDEEYEQYYNRFRRIFKWDKAIPQYFVPGNHDTGLGIADWFSPDMRSRYAAHFGEPNYKIQTANHTLVFIDAPGFVDEEYKRLGVGKSLDVWKPSPGGTWHFMQKFKRETHVDPVVLFTHIPLYRPDGHHTCGALRERGTIRPGVGIGYQNTLDKQATQKLLEAFQPSLIFSGDDHDYCEYNHTMPLSKSQPIPHTVKEISVKSLSMAMGIKRPGFQLLSLAPNELRTSASNYQSHADVPCFLPDQLGTYLHAYIPLLALSLFIVLVSQFFKPRFFGMKEESWETSRPTPSFRLFPLNLQVRRDDSEDPVGLPSPVSGVSQKPINQNIGVGTKFTSLLRSVISCLLSAVTPKSRTRRHGRWIGFIYDVRDIAIYPLSIFIFIAWWFW